METRANPAGAPADTSWPARLSPYWRLIRGDRPVGTLLLLWPTAWALWLAAGGFPPLGTLAIFLAGVWLTRSAGCVINDYADRWLDPQVERTRGRPLATGELGARQALLTFAAMMAVAFALVLLTNRLTVYLSFVGLALAATYPFLKRYTYLPQLYLGLAFGWGIPMAFAAIQGQVPELAWLLFLGNLLWTTGYDTWYAMVDRDDDLRAGAKSTAILFGDMDLVALGVLYGGFLITMLLVGGRAGLGFVYLVSLAAAAGFIAWQFVVGRDRQPGHCFRAFLGNQWVGFVVFLGIALDLALR
jgi:4-hydroxybenzoate polyprenyltransferase